MLYETSCGHQVLQCRVLGQPIYSKLGYTIGRQQWDTENNIIDTSLTDGVFTTPKYIVHMDHTFMQCWLPACSCEMIPRTRNERRLSSAGRECWRTKAIYHQILIFLENLTLDSPCPCWSELVKWLQRAWRPYHLTPADQSRPPSQTHSLHDNNNKLLFSWRRKFILQATLLFMHTQTMQNWAAWQSGVTTATCWE